MGKLAILLGGAIALAACSTNPPPPPAPIDLNNVLLAPGFLAHAGSANQYEIQASQLALQASANPGVRNLANVIIADHTAMGQQVGAAATAAGLVPPAPTLLPADQAMLDQLRFGHRNELRPGVSAAADRGSPTGYRDDAELCGAG